MSEGFELYSNNLSNKITKYNSSASSIFVPSIFAMLLMKGAYFLNSTLHYNSDLIDD